MASLLLQADRVLRGRPGDPLDTRPAHTLQRLLTYTLIGGMFYGAVMGTFGGFAGDRIWQITFSATKVPLLLVATFAISLPSFFVLNSLFGVRADFADVLRALLAAQAGLTIILAALAPYTAFWYASFTGYQPAILFNALMFGIASLAAQWLLRRYYRPLIARNRRHRLLLRTWLVLYAFVGIQMGWILRPFVGAPNMPVQFFREETWGNAYVIVARLIWDVITR
ncbi:MAG TPA: hypothetical protein VM487_09605 [Phycisphaerae bacterium]|nr:hypothetical protein [Phycisphaerae bacterium]